jgi:ClpP class serine protease
MSKRPILQEILTEQGQGFETRKTIFSDLEKILERPVISFYTSFTFPVMIDASDVTMLEDILQTINLSEGLTLILSSPGGDGLAAERMVNVCRNYSKTGEYWVIIPERAKSAATMICFGASKIYMSGVSELGPVDPQVLILERNIRASAFNVVKSYDKLFERAVKEKSGNLQPYLQQLDRYDEREIEEYRQACLLSTDISIKTLQSGMMKGQKRDKIQEKIKVFLTPEETKTHGRPIYRDEAKKCGLNIESIEIGSQLYELVHELHIRTSTFTASKASKCIESLKHSFISPIQSNKT